MKFGDLNIPPLSTLINVRSHSALKSMRGWSCKFVTHCHVLFEENFRTKNSVKISERKIQWKFRIKLMVLLEI